MSRKDDEKLFELRAKYKVYCRCGHSLVFYPLEHKNKKICSWCKNYVYINKKVEFKERLGKKL